METLGEELVANPDGFREMAAVMANLDLMVASDSAPAHLAGALGRPVWVALRDAARLALDDRPRRFALVSDACGCSARSRPRDWAGRVRRDRRGAWRRSRAQGAAVKKARARPVPMPPWTRRSRRAAGLARAGRLREAIDGLQRDRGRHGASGRLQRARHAAYPGRRRPSRRSPASTGRWRSRRPSPMRTAIAASRCSSSAGWKRRWPPSGRRCRRRPGHLNALMNSGNVLKLLGRNDEAVAGFDRVLALKPDLAEAALKRAYVQHGARRPRGGAQGLRNGAAACSRATARRRSGGFRRSPRSGASTRRSTESTASSLAQPDDSERRRRCAARS